VRVLLQVQELLVVIACCRKVLLEDAKQMQ
jgi:hypothetical protein